MSDIEQVEAIVNLSLVILSQREMTPAQKEWAEKLLCHAEIPENRMTVTPYNPGQYLVSSRTEEEVEDIVDVETLECGCPAALDFATTGPRNPCAHLEAALAKHAGAKPRRPRRTSPFTLLSCPKI